MAARTTRGARHVTNKISHSCGCTDDFTVTQRCGDENSQAVFNSESGGNHPSGWATGHKTSARANPVGCSECHGDNFDGGISRVSCMNPTAVNGFSCHATNPLESPTECISCHGAAPGGPYGNTAPNREFAHAEHTALTAITEIGCDSCHLNGGSGSINHAKATDTGEPSPAMVQMSSAYRAKTLTTFGYDGTKMFRRQLPWRSRHPYLEHRFDLL